jgi:integrase/recombinase XerD
MPVDDKIYENKHEDINEFIKRKQATGKSSKTLTEYSRTLRKFYHEHFPSLTPAETQVYHVEEYVSILQQRGLAQNTKRRYVESLSAFFDYAMKRPRFEDITGNPAAVVLEELPRKRRERPDCATWENAQAIVHQIPDPQNKTIAILLAKTGARVSEVLNLELDDLMLDTGFIRFQDRKGGTNTVNPIDRETIQTLERYKFIRNQDTEELFVNIRGNQVRREQVRRKIREAAIQADVMESGETRFHKKFTPHTFRTVFTTQMRNQGMPDHHLRYLRGDSDQDVMDLYTRIDRDNVRENYLQAIKNLNL